jgi:hypothetical protein
VISLAKLSNTFPGMQTLVKGLKGDVNREFCVPAGKDQRAGRKAAHFLEQRRHAAPDLGDQRSKTAVFLRGQRASLTFDKAGEYNYICGLHPSMKGVIEVK